MTQTRTFLTDLFLCLHSAAFVCHSTTVPPKSWWFVFCLLRTKLQDSATIIHSQFFREHAFFSLSKKVTLLKILPVLFLFLSRRKNKKWLWKKKYNYLSKNIHRGKYLYEKKSEFFSNYSQKTFCRIKEKCFFFKKYFKSKHWITPHPKMLSEKQALLTDRSDLKNEFKKQNHYCKQKPRLSFWQIIK